MVALSVEHESSPIISDKKGMAKKNAAPCLFESSASLRVSYRYVDPLTYKEKATCDLFDINNISSI